MPNNILIDTNIWLDILLDRKFAEQSNQAINLLKEEEFILYITATTITDLYYIAYRELKNDEFIKTFLKSIVGSYSVGTVSKKEIMQALNSDMKDFEDALQANVGFTNNCEWVLTRNPKDFEGSLIKPITPEELISDFKNK